MKAVKSEAKAAKELENLRIEALKEAAKEAKSPRVAKSSRAKSPRVAKSSRSNGNRH